MPKRGNKILIASLALLLALSVGYALFGDNITVSGTAVSEAELDMVATCESGVSDLLTVNGFATDIVDKGFENDTCTASDNTVNVNVDFKYPGAQRTFTVKTTNKGNLDAKLTLEKIENLFGFCWSDSITGSAPTPTLNDTVVLQKCVNNYNRKEEKVIMNSDYLLEHNYNFVTIEDENGNILSETELGEFYDKTNNILILKPNYSAYFTSSLRIDNNNENINKINLNIATKVTMPFEQAPIQ